MIGRIEVLIRKFRRWVSRSEWLARKLYPAPDSKENTPGLIMIQIDGLSHEQFQRAIKEGNLPFLNFLLRRERYHTYRMYSGLPSSTPVVQGELFYGLKGFVPAFKFRHKETGHLCVMYEPEGASEMEKVAQKGEALLKGGSAYCDIFSGGAEEAHFCASKFGWGVFIKGLNPLSVGLTILCNPLIFLRAAYLLILEFALAVKDAFHGILMKKGYFEEIHFILTRVSMCILLRELITLGVKIDIARGLPIIHLNFVGYDDQAHRRGPASKFAHWTLRGIDNAIREIWNAARWSAARDYDLWIYSDHGQEETLPYTMAYGKTVESAIIDLYQKMATEFSMPIQRAKDAEKRHPQYYGGEYPSLRERRLSLKIPKEKDSVTVTAMGPVGHIYLPENLPEAFKEKFVEALVSSVHIPLVLTLTPDGRVLALTEEGKLFIPEDAAKVLGEDHPYLKEATEDLAQIIRHLDAGNMAIMGYRKKKQYISFPVESGAHGGPGPKETDAFALLPPDALRLVGKKDYLRPIHLRHAVLNFLGRPTEEALVEQPLCEKPVTLRILTYNVHSCVGMDGKMSPDRIARVIARHQPDIVALQELDVGRKRTDSVDQAKLIADKLNMAFHFHPAWAIEEEKYGDAILSRYPMRLVRAQDLPRLRVHRLHELRGALWVEIDLGGRKLQLINTHLSFWQRECLLQAEALLGPDWIENAPESSPLVLVGDFNASPASLTFKRIQARLKDAQLQCENHRPLNTWLGRYPLGRIDHVFVSPGIKVLNIDVPSTALEKIASDHLPLIAEITLEEKCG